MPDISADRWTTARMSLLGGDYLDYFGRLETEGDKDWIRIELQANRTVLIEVAGRGSNGVGDTEMRLFDAAGEELAYNDDYGAGYGSGFRYTAATSGTYYIEVSGFGEETGDYRVTAAFSQKVAPLEALDWGSQVSDPEIGVYFAPSFERFDGYTSEGFNAYERTRFAEAFDLIEAVTNLEFTVVDRSASADFRLVLDINEDTEGFIAYFNPPGEPGAGVGVFDGTAWDRGPGGDLEAGGDGFATITHELLHGLGMAHPHDDGGSSEAMDGVYEAFDDYGSHDLNQGIFTTMSYNTGYYTGPSGSTGDPDYRWGYEIGPMALDIAVLQAKYGVNTTTAVGDTVYTLPGSNQSGTGWRAIWDVTGVDEIRADPGTTDDVTIDLRTATLRQEVGGGGFVSAQKGIAGGFTIAHGVLVENASGGAGDDHLYGNAAANTLLGGAGNDWLYSSGSPGFEGNDLLDGGTGFDRAVIGVPEIALSAVAYDHLRFPGLTFLTFADDSDIETLTLRGIEQVEFSGGRSRNIQDLIARRPEEGIRIDGNGPLAGTEGNDTIVGAEGADLLDGGLGGDTLVGKGGNDFYIVDSPLDLVREDDSYAQGGGIDTVRAFIDYVQPENVELVRLGNLTDRTALDATGNDAPGTLVGNYGNNILNGRGGNDQINGNVGNDTLIGGVGRDTLVGGNGADVFVYGSISESRAGAEARDVINGFDFLVDTIDLRSIDADTTSFGLDDAFVFVGTTGFSGRAGELRTQGLGGPNAVIVEADVTGDGMADFQIFVNQITYMTGSDFLL